MALKLSVDTLSHVFRAITPLPQKRPEKAGEHAMTHRAQAVW